MKKGENHLHLLTKEQIDWCNEHIFGGRWLAIKNANWWVNQKGEIEVKGNYIFVCDPYGSKHTESLPVKFANTTGDFKLSLEYLTSLEGSPQEVGGDFNCERCRSFKSLKGGPQKVGGDYLCMETSLESLEGAPKIISGDFWCSRTQVKSLEGGPQEVGGDFLCYGCRSLESLKGAPKKVGGDFKITLLSFVPYNYCPKVSLKSLEEFSNIEVGGIIWIDPDQKLIESIVKTNVNKEKVKITFSHVHLYRVDLDDITLEELGKFEYNLESLKKVEKSTKCLLVSAVIPDFNNSPGYWSTLDNQVLVDFGVKDIEEKEVLDVIRLGNFESTILENDEFGEVYYSLTKKGLIEIANRSKTLKSFLMNVKKDLIEIGHESGVSKSKFKVKIKEESFLI